MNIAEPEVVGSFTPAQLEERRYSLGASEVPAVLGLSKYSSPLDIFLRKTGKVRDTGTSAPAEWGLLLENVIAKKYADTHGVSLILGEKTVHPSEPWMTATPDRLVLKGWGEKFTDADSIDRGLELKNRNAHVAHLFGESGTDIMPMDIAAQCHWSMLVTQLETWDVAVLIGGNDWRWYRLHRDTEIEATIHEKAHEFWHSHVLADLPPAIDGSESWTKYIHEKFAKHTEVMLEADENMVMLLRGLAEAKAVVKDGELLVTRAENEVKMLIGDAAGIIAPDGTKATWKRTKDSTGVDYQSLAFELALKAGLSAAAQKALADTYTVVTRPGSRRLLISTPKTV